MNLTLLGGYVLAVITLLIIPGPVMALVTGTAARYGYLRAFMTIAGTHLASLILIALATLMLTGVVSLSPFLLNSLGIIGALYIGFTAIQGLRHFNTSPQATTPKASAGGFSQGFMTGIANPKDILFFLTFFPQFLTVTSNFHTSMALLCLIWVMLDFLMLSLYALVVSQWLTEMFRVRLAWLTLVMLVIISLCSALYNAFETLVFIL